MKIKIKDIEFPLILTFLAARLLSEKWGMNGVQDLFQSLEGKMAGREIDSSADLIWAIAQGSGVSDASSITYDDAGQWIFDNLGRIPEITASLAQSFSQINLEDAGKPHAPEAVAKNP